MKKYLSLLKSSLLLVGLLLLIPVTKKVFFKIYSPQKRIYVDMVADLFHPGHVEFFKKARQFGNYLIVGLISDEVCINYKRKPIMNLKERIAAVQACKYVDEVIGDAPLIISNEYIDKHKIDVVIHGNDYNKEQINLYYEAAIKRGIFKTVPYTQGISTSDIIRRIMHRKEEFGKKYPTTAS